MATIEVGYGGRTFWVRERELAGVQAQIASIVESGMPGWLSVIDGQPALLLITPEWR